MKRATWLLVAVALAVCASYGCSVSGHRVTASPALIQRIGLPVYPHAKVRYAFDLTQSLREHEMDSVLVTLETAEPVDQVDRFYQKRLGNDVSRTAILGRIQFQLFTTAGQKVVMLQRLGDVTVIRLQLTNLRLASPTASR